MEGLKKEFGRENRRGRGHPRLFIPAAAIFPLLMFLFLAVFAAAGTIIYYDLTLPDRFYLADGEKLCFDNIISISAFAYENGEAESVNLSQDAGRGESRTESAQLRLFGLFPIKTIEVCRVGDAAVIPCGSPFGIKMLTKGVMVIDVAGFESDGQIVSPASDAGIRAGDIIIAVSGKSIRCNDDIADIMAEGRTVGVRIDRYGTETVVFLKPALSSEDGRFHAGMWVRDSSAGIGTMTFYDPASGRFAGLGHPVCDVDTGDILPLYSGEIADVVINGIIRSTGGHPGELVGTFISQKASGSLVLNCNEGLYGKLRDIPQSGETVPVAMRQDIRTGSAQILSTVSGRTPESYSVEIERIDLGGTNGHDMIICVTDKRLIDTAGGIVQGMSGSPVIQDGKLVGAVTHVFVNDPCRGYAVFADTMYERMRDMYSMDAA